MITGTSKETNITWTDDYFTKTLNIIFLLILLIEDSASLKNLGQAVVAAFKCVCEKLAYDTPKLYIIVFLEYNLLCNTICCETCCACLE